MKIKNLTKTKTLICAHLYDSMFYEFETSHARFIDSGLQLAQEFPETFKIVESNYAHLKIKLLDIKHCFDLYKYNEEKVIGGIK